MPTPAITKQRVETVINSLIAAGWPAHLDLTEAAFACNISRSNASHYVNVYAKQFKIKLPERALEVKVEFDAIDNLRLQLKSAEAELKRRRDNDLTDRYIRSKIYGLADAVPSPPQWQIVPKVSKSSPGVPTLLASDWHWAEVIKPEQIGGVNEYNLAIAKRRARALIENTIDLLDRHMVNPHYPYIVFALGGDMVSGDIHDELKDTNDMPLIAAVLDLLDVLIWCINSLAEQYGKVFVPCVTGNHGRNTQKIRNKDRAYTSFDWQLYTLLEKHFQHDDRVSFLIPAGPDARYQIFDHRYLLTHGDQFRSFGDSMIGVFGPIIRGDHKKRSRNSQIGMEYDTLVMGHWHTLIQTNRIMANGSLCGYNEYAFNSNFPFEKPRQALWITHQKHGITFSMPVNVERG